MFLRCLGMFLDVLGSFRMFFDVFFFTFWLFWYVSGHFGTFLEVLQCFWTFWDVFGLSYFSSFLI